MGFTVGIAAGQTINTARQMYKLICTAANGPAKGSADFEKLARELRLTLVGVSKVPILPQPVKSAAKFVADAINDPPVSLEGHVGFTKSCRGVRRGLGHG